VNLLTLTRLLPLASGTLSIPPEQVRIWRYTARQRAHELKTKQFDNEQKRLLRWLRFDGAFAEATFAASCTDSRALTKEALLDHLRAHNAYVQTMRAYNEDIRLAGMKLAPNIHHDLIVTSSSSSQYS
jgi:hypothetical protein